MKALNRQSWLDLAVQHGGTIEELFELAAANDISVTDEVDVGMEYAVPDALNKNIVEMYARQEYAPATDIAFTGTSAWGGINYMGIEVDFIVS